VEILLAVNPGNYYVILRSNILDSLPETTLSNNLSASLTQASIVPPELPFGTSTSGTLATGASYYY
jgi:hypothetical protein